MGNIALSGVLLPTIQDFLDGCARIKTKTILNSLRIIDLEGGPLGPVLLTRGREERSKACFTKRSLARRSAD